MSSFLSRCIPLTLPVLPARRYALVDLCNPSLDISYLSSGKMTASIADQDTRNALTRTQTDAGKTSTQADPAMRAEFRRPEESVTTDGRMTVTTNETLAMAKAPLRLLNQHKRTTKDSSALPVQTSKGISKPHTIALASWMTAEAITGAITGTTHMLLPLDTTLTYQKDRVGNPGLLQISLSSS